MIEVIHKELDPVNTINSCSDQGSLDINSVANNWRWLATRNKAHGCVHMWQLNELNSLARKMEWAQAIAQRRHSVCRSTSDDDQSAIL
jgi:hypothetical protein